MKVQRRFPFAPILCLTINRIQRHIRARIFGILMGILRYGIKDLFD